MPRVRTTAHAKSVPAGEDRLCRDEGHVLACPCGAGAAWYKRPEIESHEVNHRATQKAEVQMASESLLVSEVVPAAPREIFSAWLDTNTHSAFTGETANIEPFVGGSHSAFNGYATGRFVRLEKDHLIAATWRSTEFPDDAADSHIEVTLEETVGGTTLTLLHTDIPDGLAEQCRDAWIKYYLVPLRQHFATRADADGVDDEVRVVVTTEDPEEATDALDDGVSETGKGASRAGGRASARGRNGVASHAESAGMDDLEDEEEEESDASEASARSARNDDEDDDEPKTATPMRGASSQRTAKTKDVAPPGKAAPSRKAAPPVKAASKATPPVKTVGAKAAAAKMPSRPAAPTKAATTSKAATSKAATKAATTRPAKGGTPPKTKAVASGAKKGRLAAPSKKKAGRKAVGATPVARSKRPARAAKAKAAKGRGAMAASSKPTRKPATRLAAKKKSAAAKPSPKGARGKKASKSSARQRR